MKKLVAERDLEIEVVRGSRVKKPVSAPAGRRQVAYSRERGLPTRRACTLFRVARSALNYASRKAAADAPVIVRMKALSAQYPRYGYRRICIFLGRDGHRMSIRRAYWLWQAAGCKCRANGRAGEWLRHDCAPTAIGAEPGVVLRLRVRPSRQRAAAQGLTVTDEFTKKGWAIDVGGRSRSLRVIEVL